MTSAQPQRNIDAVQRGVASTASVDPQLPKEQAGFRRGKSTTDQVTLLTQDIEDTFQVGEKAGVVLLDLTAAYDTVWHRGLHLKLLQLTPDRQIVNFVMEMLRNRRFILHTSDGQRSRPRRLKNGVPRGSVLAPCYSTPTSMISQRHSLRSTDTQMTWLSYSMTSNGRRLKQDSRQT